MFWFNQIEKIKFLWQAQNAHGLHSPYVFSFYNSIKTHSKIVKPLSGEINDFSDKELRIILAIIQNLKPLTILEISNEEQKVLSWATHFLSDREVLYAKSLNKLPEKPSKFDLIILHNLLLINQKELQDNLVSLIYNDSAVIIPHIHASKDSKNKWETLIKNNDVSVSLDLFFIGILLFRKESTKQEFRLRF